MTDTLMVHQQTALANGFVARHSATVKDHLKLSGAACNRSRGVSTAGMWRVQQGDGVWTDGRVDQVGIQVAKCGESQTRYPPKSISVWLGEPTGFDYDLFREHTL